MRTFIIITLPLLLIGCSNVFQPNTTEMRTRLDAYKKMHDISYSKEHFEDRKFRFVGNVLHSDKEYEIVYYKFFWNMTSSDSSWHQSQKLFVYKNGAFIKEYYLLFCPAYTQVTEGSKVILTDENGGTHVLDFSDGLPEQNTFKQ
jgi:hypothetical protein